MVSLTSFTRLTFYENLVTGRSAPLRPPEASIPVIIIERHIGYQFPDRSSPQQDEPSLSTNARTQASVHTPDNLNSYQTSGGTRQWKAEEQTPVVDYDHPEVRKLPSKPSVPYYGQGEYRRSFVELQRPDFLRRNLPSSTPSEQQSPGTTVTVKPKFSENTGIFVKAGRVLSNEAGKLLHHRDTLVMCSHGGYSITTSG